MLVVRQRAGRVFHVEARRCRALLRSSAILRATVSGEPTWSAPCSTSCSNCVAPHRRPAALAADLVVHGLVAGPVFLARLLVGVGDVARRVHGDRLRRPAELGERAVIEIDKGAEALRIAADDGERERQIVVRGAHHGFRLPPTPIQVVSGPSSIGGKTRWFFSGGRVCALPGHGVGCAAAPRTGRAFPRTALRIGTDRSRTAETTR